MNGHCSTCDVEAQCGYKYKPCDCAGYRKFTPKTEDPQPEQPAKSAPFTRSTPKAGGAMRPDIAQAIHDAAVSDRADYLDTVASMILRDAFVSIIDWSRAAEHPDCFHGWLRTDEGRTYMLFVAEALS